MCICQDVCRTATAFCNNNWYSRIPGHRLQDCENSVGSPLKYKQYHRYPMRSLCDANSNKDIMSNLIVSIVLLRLMALKNSTHSNVYFKKDHMTSTLWEKL